MRFVCGDEGGQPWEPIGGQTPRRFTELRNFTIKTTAAGNDTMATLRERDHDNLVLASALRCWWSEQKPLPARQHALYL
jgi:hypothetical protein